MLLFVTVWVIASANEIVKRYVEVVRKGDEIVKRWLIFSIFPLLIISFGHTCGDSTFFLRMVAVFANGTKMFIENNHVKTSKKH